MYFFFFTDYSSVVIVSYIMYGMLRIRGTSQRWGFHEFFLFHQGNAEAVPENLFQSLRKLLLWHRYM